MSLKWWIKNINAFAKDKSIPQQVLPRGSTLRIWSKFTEEHPHQSVTSTKLHSNFIEMTFQHRSYTANLLHTHRTPPIRKCMEDCFWKKLYLWKNFKYGKVLCSKSKCRMHAQFLKIQELAPTFLVRKFLDIHNICI